MKEFNKIEVFKVDCEEFEKLVKEIYGHNYRFCADVECGNDTDHFISDVGEWTFSEYEKDQLRVFIVGGKYWFIARLLLEDMAHRGIIPKGNYLISV